MGSRITTAKCTHLAAAECTCEPPGRHEHRRLARVRCQTDVCEHLHGTDTCSPACRGCRGQPPPSPRASMSPPSSPFATQYTPWQGPPAGTLPSGHGAAGRGGRRVSQHMYMDSAELLNTLRKSSTLPAQFNPDFAQGGGHSLSGQPNRNSFAGWGNGEAGWLQVRSRHRVHRAILISARAQAPQPRASCSTAQPQTCLAARGAAGWRCSGARSRRRQTSPAVSTLRPRTHVFACAQLRTPNSQHATH